MTKKAFFVVAAALAVCGPRPAHSDPVMLDRVVAEVNGEVITLSEVAERVERLERELQGSADAETFQKESQAQRGHALETMIDELLVMQEGKRLDVEVTDEDVDRALANVRKENNITSDAQFQYLLQAQNFTLEEYRTFLKRQMLVLQTRRKALGGVEITDEEIRAYYAANKEDFRRPPSVHLRHILFRVPQDSSPVQVDAIERRAQKVLQDIRGGADFGQMAIRYSEDPSAAKGGDIGVLTSGQMLPEFEAVAFKLPVQQVSDPVRTKYGLHLVEVIERTEGSYQPVEEVADKLREFLQDRRIQSKQDEWLSKLRDQAYVKIYDRPKTEAAGASK
jgi:peptidyl-prolyl cis-trans isomerase SurA